MLSVEGITRELKGYFGIEQGVPEYKLKKSNVKVLVDPKLKYIRPKAAYAVAKNVEVSDEFLRQLIQLQEKICETFGRRRKEIAIGIFDYDKVSGRELRYYAASPKEKFVPLGFSEEMSLAEILRRHPKGIEYGYLLEGFSKYPLLVDSAGEVLSMPPIINSEYSGKVTLETNNLFIDVTGFNQELINVALDVVCAALYDRGAKIARVEVVYTNGSLWTPELCKKTIEVPKEEITNVLGLDLNSKEITNLARKKRLSIAEEKANSYVFEYSSYRADIMHAVDIIEELAIAYGYENFKPLAVEIPSTGATLPERNFLETLREACIGLGLQEVLTFILTSKQKQQALMNLQEVEFVELENPMSAEFAVFRSSIIPEHLAFLSKNQHCRYPQKIFEVGKVVELLNAKDYRERYAVCVSISAKHIDFNEIKSYLDTLCKACSLSYKLEPFEHNSFEKGLCAKLKGKDFEGIIGIINKEVLKNFNLKANVAVFELKLDLA